MKHYYAVSKHEGYLEHSKGPWKAHKYIRKVGKKYFYKITGRPTGESSGGATAKSRSSELRRSNHAR